MLLDEKMDHGPIVASEEYDIIDESITAEKTRRRPRVCRRRIACTNNSRLDCR